MTTAEFSYW